MLERTLVFVKPGNEERAGEIFNYLEGRLGDFRRVGRGVVEAVPKDKIEEHYANLRGLPCFEWTVDAITGRKIIIRVYEGEDIIERTRTIVGNTDPQKAEPGTIRREFGADSLEKAVKEERYLDNIIHASDSEGVEREMRIWEDYVEKEL